MGKKAKNANDDLKKQIVDKERRLSLIGKDKQNANVKEAALATELEKLRKELDALRKTKSQMFDEFVDKKAELDAKYKELEAKYKQAMKDLDAQKDENSQLKQIVDKERRLSLIGKDKQNANDKEAALATELE